MHRRSSGDSLQRPVESFQAEVARLIGTRLHVRFVDLHDIGARRKQIADFRVERRRIVGGCETAAAVVVVDLRLLGHGEGTGYGHLDEPVGVLLQEPHVVHADGVAAFDRAYDPGHRIGMAAAIQRRARIVEIHSVERGGKPVGIALTTDLAVGDDVQTCALLCADRHNRCVILRFGEIRLRNPPQLARANSRRETPCQLRAIDQPLRLRKAPHQCRRKQHLIPSPKRLSQSGHALPLASCSRMAAPCSFSNGAARTD